MTLKLLPLLGCAVALCTACSSGLDGGTSVTFNRSAMLVNWADNIILPSYKAFQSELSGLNNAFETFNQNKTEPNLQNFRAAWVQTYTAWQTVSMFETGLAESITNDGYRLSMNTYPADAALIDTFIEEGNYDLAVSANRDAKGFPALDYLLNGLEDSDAALVARVTSGADAANLLQFITDVLDDMTTLTNQVVGAWEDGFRDAFVANDGASVNASVDRLVNAFILYYEKFLRAGKMGIPLGVFSGTRDAGKLEAFYKPDLSNVLFLKALDAVQDFFNGKHFEAPGTGASLASTLNDLDRADLAQNINDQLNTAREKVLALDLFRNEIENNTTPTAMLLAYNEVDRVVALLKVDMVSAMSISITYVDADGD